MESLHTYSIFLVAARSHTWYAPTYGSWIASVYKIRQLNGFHNATLYHRYCFILHLHNTESKHSAGARCLALVRYITVFLKLNFAVRSERLIYMYLLLPLFLPVKIAHIQENARNALPGD